MINIKHILVLVTTLLMVACNSDSAVDCFQSAGDIIREEVSVSDFTTITVFENVGLVLKEGAETKVEIETGEFLRNEVEAIVENGRLLLRDTNNCNFVRPYGLTKIYVTAPNITEIRSSTGLLIESDGVLSYPVLRLISESFTNSESETTDGEFDLELDSDVVSILVNGITYFNLRGSTDFFRTTIAAGDSRIEAQNLIANSIEVNHRGSNDILVRAVEEITGTIRGTGDVVSYTRPNLIQVEELFKGKLIFKDEADQ